jgi:hypothetical protein
MNQSTVIERSKSGCFVHTTLPVDNCSVRGKTFLAGPYIHPGHYDQRIERLRIC